MSGRIASDASFPRVSMLNCCYLGSSQGHELLLWEAPTGAKLSRAFEARDVVWGTNTVTYGWDRQGIWPVGSTGGEVMCLDVSGGMGGVVQGGVRRIMTGDSLGHIKLFRCGPREMMSNLTRNLTECDVDVERYVVVGCDCALVGFRGSSYLSVQVAG